MTIILCVSISYSTFEIFRICAEVLKSQIVYLRHSSDFMMKNGKI